MLSVFVYICIFSFNPKSLLAEFMLKNADNYGPYDITSIRVEPCRGPKSKDLAALSVDMVPNADNSSQIAVFNVTFFGPTNIYEVKISTSTIKGKERRILWNNKITDPCRHYSLAMIFVQLLNANNCEVNKGTIIFEVNTTERAKSFFGESFFFGEYVFKIVVLSKKGNIGCLTFYETFSKKQK